MNKNVARALWSALVLAVCLVCLGPTNSQEPQVGGSPVAAQDDIPGVEVQARGPVHEAFATPTSESRATPLIPRKPPANIDEMPPDEKPEGDVVWIGGYWAWNDDDDDDDRNDFLWVSGCWRAKPASREWVPGYWRENGNKWQWVSGFWALQTEGAEASDVVYHPEPPALPNIAPPPPPQQPDMFYVPGNWVWVDSHYVWRAGYYTRIRQNYVYVPGHYRWSPYGYIYVAGYWDAAMPRRGLLYAPVMVNTVVVGPRFVYTPCYAVSDTLVLDTLFIRPSCSHYYFGDYYGPRYARRGFHSCVVYSQRHYDPVITYQRWEYRNNPAWFNLQVNLVFDRNNGRAPLPPRTLVQQRNVTNNITKNTTIINNTTINNVTMLAPARTVVAARGAKTVAVDQTARAQAKQNSQVLQQASTQQRLQTETSTPANPGAANKVRAAKLKVPTLQADNRPNDPRPGPRPGPRIDPPQTKGAASNPTAGPKVGATSPAPKGIPNDPPRKVVTSPPPPTPTPGPSSTPATGSPPPKKGPPPRVSPPPPPPRKTPPPRDGKKDR